MTTMELVDVIIIPNGVKITSVVVVISLLLLWYLLLRPRRGAGVENAPPLVLTSSVIPIPFIGVLIEFFKSPNTMVWRCLRDYGPIFTIPIAHKRMTFLVGPEGHEVVFKASDDVLSVDEPYSFMNPIFGKNVVYDAPKDPPKRMRQVQFQVLANGLRAQRLKAYVSKIEEETRKYFKQEWGDSGERCILKALSELTILTASRSLHGDDVRKHIFKEVQVLYHALDEGLTPLGVFWPNAPTSRHFKRDAARREMEKLFRDVIAERRQNPNRTDGTDLLSLLMESKYKDGSPFTDEECVGWLVALLFAGQHTSSIASTWTALFVANDPTILQRVLDEQRSILKNDMNKPLEYDDITEMELLHNCMRESLRMCPTFIMIIRKAECNIDCIIGNQKYTIPKDDFVVISPTVAMRLKSVFPNPDTFDPDRFFSPRDEHKIPFAYLGFGGGVHGCMGQSFAFLQVKTILSILFREYEFQRIAKHMPSVGYDDIVVGPKGDCRVRYTKRKQQQQ